MPVRPRNFLPPPAVYGSLSADHTQRLPSLAVIPCRHWQKISNCVRTVIQELLPECCYNRFDPICLRWGVTGFTRHKIPAVVIYALILSFLPCGGSPQASEDKASSKIELRRHQFYIDGRPFFVKAVSYNPFRPCSKSDKGKAAVLDLVERDFKRIKQAGFNAVRGQYSLPPEQISLASKYGLYVIQSLNLPNVKGDWRPDALKKIKDVIEYSKFHANILMYLIPLEFPQQAILELGEENISGFLSEAIKLAKAKDKKPVSVESRVQNAFLLTERGDVVSFAAFDFMPSCLNQIMGFPGYLEWLRYTYAEGKPFFISLSAAHSAYAIDEETLGFGALDETQQSKLILADIEDIIKAGSLGYCVFSWLDEWGYVEESDAYSDTPWEWTGLIAIDVDKDAAGKERKAYSQLRKFNSGLADIKEVLPPKLEEEGLICSIMPKEIMYAPGDKIEMEVMVTNKENKPRPGVIAIYSFFSPVTWEVDKGALTTNKDGRVFPACKLELEEKTQYLLFSVSVKEGGNIFGDIIFVKIEPKTEVPKKK